MNNNHPFDIESHVVPFTLLVLCILGLLLTASGCATYKVRVPFGSDEQYGAVDIGVTYYPPRDFTARLHDWPATLKDK